MAFQLRPYQLEAVNAVNEFVCIKQGNPCVSMPTGSGKSPTMAALIRLWQKDYPNLRGCVLAHRKELVQQNYEKLQSQYGESGGGNIGIFSAGLGRRDYHSPIVFASIDSVYNKSGEFAPFDFIFVDEAHRIPFSGEGKYRSFLSGCRRFNPKLCIVGWTATPWRMAGGALCHPDHILNSVCYEAKLTDLIAQGYLCPLRSKIGVSHADLSEVRRQSGGDYITKSLSTAVNVDSLVSSAIGEAVRIIRAEARQAIVFYCVDVQHCEKVSLELRRYGIEAPCLTAKTKTSTRDRMVDDFKAQRIHAICNVNVLTEGFDAPHIDCVVLLRPTLSAGLFSQMVGRGLRLWPDKHDCLVLDFAGCIDEHGPVDLLGGAPVKLVTCEACRETFSRVTKVCPACGREVPKIIVERAAAEEREKRLHGTQASTKSILSDVPEILKVDTVYVNRHKKPGSPDSVRIQFRCGLRMFRHWCLLDHAGPAGNIAQEWWRKYAGNSSNKKQYTSVDEALGDLLISQTLLDSIHTITVRRHGKYHEIVAYNQPLST
jgi:DNA repair protein RadD